MDYLSKDALLAALTHTHEKTVESYFLGGKVLIRELTARQRLMAQQAAQADNPEEPDDGFYQAMLIQMCVVDPESGTPDAGGHIDPRTRAPLFTVEDVRNLMEARYGAVTALIEEITSLAGLGPAAMFSGNHAADGGERDAGAGAQGVSDAAGEVADQGTGDTDERGALADDAGAADGAKPGGDAG